MSNSIICFPLDGSGFSMLAPGAMPWGQKVCLSVVIQALEPLGNSQVWGGHHSGASSSGGGSAGSYSGSQCV